MKYKPMVCLLLAFACCALLPFSAAARSSGEIQQELDALQEQAAEIEAGRAALEQELAENGNQTQSVIEQKSAIDRRISITEQEIQNTNSQIRQYSLLIAEKQAELEAAQAALAERNEAYKTRLRAMEEAGPISYWSVLFKASSFSDLLSRIDSIREVARADQRMLQELSDLAQTVEDDRNSLQACLTAQQTTQAQLATLEAELGDQRAEADRLLLALAAEAENLTEDYLASQARADALRQEILDAQAAYEAALSAEEAARLAALNSGNAAGGTSGLGCPLPPGAWVTSSYGPREHPLYGYDGFHTGVDLAANQGTSIYAAAAGTVTTAAYDKVNGYYVAISHGGGYGTVYCHMSSYIVAVGDSVTQGQVIGYVGSTGWSKGPHLHFEVHVNGAAANPMEYISLS